AYPPAQAYPPHRPLPTLADADDDAPFYDPTPGRPVPPVGVGQEALPPPGLPVGRQGVEEADLPPPLPGAALREPPPGYIPVPPPRAPLGRAGPPAVGPPAGPPAGRPARPPPAPSACARFGAGGRRFASVLPAGQGPGRRGCTGQRSGCGAAATGDRPGTNRR